MSSKLRSAIMGAGWALALGATAALAQPTLGPEGLICDWLIAGPVPLNEKASHHDATNQKEFFDKEQISGQFKGSPVDGEGTSLGLSWKAIQQVDGIVRFKPQDNVMHCCVAYITAPSDIHGLTLLVGADDSSCWRLNDREVLRVHEGRAVARDQYRSGPVSLKKGLNVLRGAIINGGGPTGMCARFVRPVAEIGVTLSPW